MISKIYKWNNVYLYQVHSDGLTELGPEKVKGFTDSVSIISDSRADPLEAIPELPFLTHSATIYGIKVYNIHARQQHPIFGFDDDGQAYSVMSEFEHFAIWRMPSGRVCGALMKDDIDSITVFSDLALKLSRIEMQSTEPVK